MKGKKISRNGITYKYHYLSHSVQINVDISNTFSENIAFN